VWTRLQQHDFHRLPSTFSTVAGRHLAVGRFKRLAELVMSTMAMSAASTALGTVGDYAAQGSCR